MNKTENSIVVPVETVARVEAAIARTKGCRFASLTYLAKKTGELARHTVLLGASLENAYKADIETLESKLPSLSGAESVACQQLIDSLKNSLEKGIGQNDSYTKKGMYEQITPGLKKLSNDGTFEILGMVVSKEVIQPGEYKAVKSRNEITAAKKVLRKDLKSGKIRTFSVDYDTFCRAAVNGDQIFLD